MVSQGLAHHSSRTIFTMHVVSDRSNNLNDLILKLPFKNILPRILRLIKKVKHELKSVNKLTDNTHIKSFFK